MVSPFTFRIEMLRVRRLAANNSSSNGIMIPSIDGEKDDFRFPKKTCPFSSGISQPHVMTLGGTPVPIETDLQTVSQLRGRPPLPRSRWHIDESWVAYKTCQGRVVETAGEPCGDLWRGWRAWHMEGLEYGWSTLW